ncbi:Cytochrome c oxidase subunit 3 [Candidatus Entotheonellaceae bacterium PAL068K]
MSETAAAHAEAFETPLTPESWGKLGMWVFLIGDAMSFGTLLAAYGAIRYGSGDWPNPHEIREILGIDIAGAMTFLLIFSSVTMVKGLSAARRDDLIRFRWWIGLTIAGGVLFLFGQSVIEWPEFIHEGLGFTKNNLDAAPDAAPLFGTTFFVITGFHGMHVMGGVIYLACILIKGWNGAYQGENADRVEIAGLYWHFVDLVWIMVFTFIYML